MAKNIKQNSKSSSEEERQLRRTQLAIKKANLWLGFFVENLLLATVGSILAFFGAMLAASQLLLFGIVGAAMMVVGLQVLYAAVQEAGVISSVVRPADFDSKTVSKTPRKARNKGETVKLI